MIKKVLIAVPLEMLKKIDKLTELEHRTRSELVRESLRRYIREGFKELGLSELAFGLSEENTNHQDKDLVETEPLVQAIE